MFITLINCSIIKSATQGQHIFAGQSFFVLACRHDINRLGLTEDELLALRLQNEVYSTKNRWWEAKSGQFWKMLEDNPKELSRFKDAMGQRKRIAADNGASYELFSNTPIPDSIKEWLTKKGIPFTEILH